MSEKQNMIRKKMNYTSSGIKINKKRTITYVIFPLFTSFCALIFFSGCKTPPKVVAPKLPAAVREAPSSPKVELEELLLDKIEEEKDVERLFSLIIRGQNIGQVLLALSRQVPYNIVVEPDVTGMVTIDLKGVTLIEALDTLTSLLELKYEIRGKNIIVSIPKMKTRIFPLNYINVARTGSSNLTATTGVSGDSGGGGGTSDGGDVSIENTSEFMDIWTEIEEGLAIMVSEEGKVVLNKLANMIMVTDFPKNLESIAEFLEMIEGSSHRQVMIEAKIIEVILDEDYKMGLDWSALHNVGGHALGNLTGGRVVSQSLAPDTSNFSFGVTSFDLTALIDAMSSQGETHILSSPKISTLNNQKAVIKAARDEVFFDPNFTITPVLGGATTSVLSSVEARTISIGVVLDVTPQISSNGYIIMNIHPSVTELVRIDSFSSGGSVIATAPVINIRETDTVVRVRDGQTIIIAGMMSEKKSETVTKSPLLGSIPGLGALFRKTDQQLDKTELVILLTPTIMTGRRIDYLTREELRRLEIVKRDFHLGILRK